MRKVRVVSALLFLSISLLTLPAFGADSEKTFLWKVTSDGGGEVYLLGSVHVGKKDWYPLPKEIEQAYEKSKFLAVEVDTTKIDQLKLMKFMQEKGMYGAGDSISKHVSKETDTKIQSYLEKNGQPAAMMMQFKPWALGLVVTMLEMKNMGFDETQGIDIHFLNAANDKGKKVIELETMDSQLELLSGFDDDLQEKSLLATFEDMAEMKTDINKLIDAYKKGDAKELETIFNKTVTKHPEFKPVMKKLLDDRNVGMAEKIEGFLKTKDVHFVIVGAAHLVGEKGVVKMLEDKKYKVEQILKSAAPAPAEKEKEPVGAEK